MSSGTFSLAVGPPDVATDAQSFAGSVTPGLLTPATTPVAQLVGDVAVMVKDAPTQIINLAYMRACRDFCKRSMWLKRNIATATLTVGQPLYNFGSDATLEVIGIAAVSIQQQNTTWIDIRPMTQGFSDPNQANDIPLWYSYIPENMIRYYPTPNLAYGSKVELICQTSLNAVAVPNDLINKFNIYIEEGCLSYLYQIPKQPWTNPELAAAKWAMFMEGIGMAKSWRDKGDQMASVRATPRTFIPR
jgi:hypothetical protein